MKKFKIILAYSWALLATPLVLACFIGMDFWMKLFVQGTGVRVTPWATGGEVKRVIDHGEYETQIHETVFQALMGERPEGFVQVNWAPREKTPKVIEEEIDYDADGQNDFKLVWNTQTHEATLTPYVDSVKGLQGKYELKKSFSIRVDLKNKK